MEQLRFKFVNVFVHLIQELALVLDDCATNLGSGNHLVEVREDLEHVAGCHSFWELVLQELDQLLLDLGNRNFINFLWVFPSKLAFFRDIQNTKTFYEDIISFFDVNKTLVLACIPIFFNILLWKCGGNDRLQFVMLAPKGDNLL